MQKFIPKGGTESPKSRQQAQRLLTLNGGGIKRKQKGKGSGWAGGNAAIICVSGSVLFWSASLKSSPAEGALIARSLPLL